MMSLKKGIAIIFIVFISTKIFASDGYKNIFNTQLPKIEIQTNVGFIWFVQLAGNLNINDNIYMKCRTSITFLTSEKAILLGYQYFENNKNRIQIGLGYTRGIYNPSGSSGSSDKDSKFSSGTLEVKFIHYFTTGKVRFGLNTGGNLIVVNDGLLPNLNVGLIVGLF